MVHRNSTFSAWKGACALAVLFVLAGVLSTFASPREAARAKIEASLAEPVSLDFTDAALSEVIDFLSQTTHTQIYFDRRPLEEAGIASDTLVSIRLKGVLFESALNLFLDDLGLTYVIRDEVLMITTRDEANNRLETVVYPAKDLLERTDRTFRVGNDNRNGFTNVVEETIAPDSWETVGGRGSIRIDPRSKSLAISQTQEVHRQLRDFFAQLRENPAVADESESDSGKEAKYTLRVYSLAKKERLSAGGGCWGSDGKGMFAVDSESSDSKPVNTHAPPPESGGGGLSGLAGGKVSNPRSGDSVYSPERAAKDLASSIPKLIGPEEWDPKNKELSIVALGSKLAIRQTPAVHAKIEDLLEDLLD